MGNPFVHIDLATDDPKAAKKFYKSVFDWKFTDFPDMKWSAIGVGKGTGGGLSQTQSPSDKPAWTAYVDVADVKKTIAKAKKAGATVVVPYMAIGNMGALGVFVDPQGATIGVWEQAKKAPKKAATAKKATAKKPAKKKSR